jgi:hypothetical protein
VASEFVLVPLRDQASVGLAYDGAGASCFGFGESMPRVGIPAAGICLWEAGAVTGRAAATRFCIDIDCSLKNRVKSEMTLKRKDGARKNTCA